MGNPFAEVVAQLDLREATRRGSKRNDLLPPRHEDAVLGETGTRFSEGLRARMERGRYDPSPAVLVHVPKHGSNATRPAALLCLTDRVVYDALVQALRDRIESALLGDQIVFWPRGLDADKRWSDFDKAPLATGLSYVTRTDITGFYECIDHEHLRDALVDITGQRAIVNALIEFLGRVMNARRGLPQGLDASDPLATAYLVQVDAEMSRECLHYVRNGDDVRLATRTVGEARRALHVFERALRKRGLLLNASKSIIMKAEKYRSASDRESREAQKTRDKLLKRRVGELRDEERLIALLEKAGREQLGWDLFYHHRISLDEVVQELADHLTPTDTEVALAFFREAMKNRPGASARALSSEAFHHRITWSLVRLAAARSPEAIGQTATLLIQFPEKTEHVAQYLLALGDEHAPGITAEVIKVLKGDRFRTSWETVWSLQVLAKFARQLTAPMLQRVRAIAQDEDEDAYCRVEALAVLARHGECDHALVRRLWNIAPRCFLPDLVAAVHFAGNKEPWCKSFIAGTQEDPVNVVVLKQLERQRGRAGSERPSKPSRGSNRPRPKKPG